MSVEKINNLIDQAPGVSQWWTSNKRALNRWVIGMTGAIIPVLFITLLSVATTLLGYVSWMDGSLPADKYWTLIAAPLVSFCGMGVMKFGHKVWPKRFTYKGFTLTRFTTAERASLAFTHNVLSKAVKIDDPQMKPVLARLSALKEMDLPKCWWEALFDELDNLTQRIQPQPLEKSIQDKVDAVYIQMEDAAASPSNPKVFRL